MVSARVQQALERLQEDESLLGELMDPAATALNTWVEHRVAAADDAGDDAAFAARVTEIRAAAKAAARAGLNTGEAVTAHADALLNGAESRSIEPASRTTAAAPISAAPTPVRDVRTSPAAALLQGAPAPHVAPESSAPPSAATPPETPNTAPRSVWSKMRSRVRRWSHRKARS